MTSVAIKIINSAASPIVIQPSEDPSDDCLLFEDAVIRCCRELNIPPAVRHLFGLRIEGSNLYTSLSDLLHPGNYELRLRFWPSLGNLSQIGQEALNYLYFQVLFIIIQKLTTLLQPVDAMNKNPVLVS